MLDVFCNPGELAVPLSLLDGDSLAARLPSLDEADRAWIEANGFTAAAGKFLAMPGPGGRPARIFFGIARMDDPYALAAASSSLPPGDYRIEHALDPECANRLAFGWGLGAYRFTRYAAKKGGGARLVWPTETDRAHVMRELAAVKLVRDLVNTPANDLGPAALAEAAQAMAFAHGATCRITAGDALLDANYPAIHAVGRAAAEAPRLVDISWGEAGQPLIALVGKGITFDTGGLDLKPSSNMILMKKDMGGAAHALALGQMIMEAKLPVRLRILVAIAENAIGPGANRPGDVIKTRLGLTVEIGNTDAEGRLVLADALSAASEDDPAMILDFATLTGAARVALGPDLPALFATDPLADEILASSVAVEDPVWRLPLWQPYRKDIESKIADMNNVSANSFAGAIHAALFMQSFVKPGLEWAHFDLYAWNATARPGRPVGGEAFALRALFHMLTKRYAP